VKERSGKARLRLGIWKIKGMREETNGVGVGEVFYAGSRTKLSIVKMHKNTKVGEETY